MRVSHRSRRCAHGRAHAGGPNASPPVAATLRRSTRRWRVSPPASDEIRQAQRRAGAALSQLRMLPAAGRLNRPRITGSTSPPSESALDAALRAGDAGSIAATVQAVAEDLEIKLEHCTRSGGKLGGAVTVRVRTLQGSDGDQELAGLLHAEGARGSRERQSPDLFPQLSSPTEEALVPGRYVMWVRDPSTSTVGERTVVKVGEGKKELILELPVPADTRAMTRGRPRARAPQLGVARGGSRGSRRDRSRARAAAGRTRRRRTGVARRPSPRSAPRQSSRSRSCRSS